MTFVLGHQDLHEAGKVCQGKGVPWDVVTLQSHIFCHPFDIFQFGRSDAMNKYCLRIKRSSLETTHTMKTFVQITFW